MRETTAQIAAFCTEQGLGTMRVGGEVRPPHSPQQQGQGVAGDSPTGGGGVPQGGGGGRGGGGPGPESIYTVRKSIVYSLYVNID